MISILENERSGFNWGYSIYPVKFLEEEERSELVRLWSI